MGPLLPIIDQGNLQMKTPVLGLGWSTSCKEIRQHWCQVWTLIGLKGSHSSGAEAPRVHLDLTCPLFKGRRRGRGGRTAPVWSTLDDVLVPPLLQHKSQGESRAWICPTLQGHTPFQIHTQNAVKKGFCKCFTEMTGQSFKEMKMACSESMKLPSAIWRWVTTWVLKAQSSSAEIEHSDSWILACTTGLTQIQTFTSQHCLPANALQVHYPASQTWAQNLKPTT